MYQKNKILISSIGLVIFSALSTTGATFAWFVTNRNATINFSSARVYTENSDLIIDFKSSLNTFTGSPVVDEVDNSVTISGINKVTDISGDGLNFYKPIWSSIINEAQEINEVTSSGTPKPADGYYVDFTIELSADIPDGDPANLILFLGGVSISPNNPLETKDINTVKATRMAVINYDDFSSDTGNPSVAILYAPEAETSPIYLSEYTDVDPNPTPAYAQDDFILVDATSSSPILKSTPFAVKQTLAEARALYPEILDLSTTNKGDVTFRFWIEGTDADAINSIVGGVFTVELNIYALQA